MPLLQADLRRKRRLQGGMLHPTRPDRKPRRRPPAEKGKEEGEEEGGLHHRCGVPRRRRALMRESLLRLLTNTRGRGNGEPCHTASHISQQQQASEGGLRGTPLLQPTGTRKLWHRGKRASKLP